MRSSIALGAALLPLLVTSAACVAGDSTGTEGPDVRTTTQAIQGGQSAGTKYPFVLGMVSQLGGGFGICSGTLIAPNLVMTARHCVSETSSNNIDCQSTKFTTTNTASEMAVTDDTVMHLQDNSGNYLEVQKVIVPDDKSMCGHDVALLILKENIDPDTATPVRPQIYKKITDGTGLQKITAIGYGTTDGQNDSGTRRIRQNIPVVCAYDHPKASLDCNNSQQDISTLMTESDLAVGTGVCEGDSGSSAFDQAAFDKGEFVSVGILSRGAAGGCDLGVYTRVDALADIIVDAANQAAEAGGYDVPSWVNPPSDPGGTCTEDYDCKEGSCIEAGDAKVCAVDCTDTCDDSTMTCTDGHCVVPPPVKSSSSSGSSGDDDDSAAADDDDSSSSSKKSSGGCSVSADPTKPIPWRNGSGTAALALGVALLLRRRSSR